MESAKIEEVKYCKATLHRSKDKFMEEQERDATLNVANAKKATQVALLNRVRENVGKTLESLDSERN